jgi:hypothetical protein
MRRAATRRGRWPPDRRSVSLAAPLAASTESQSAGRAAVAQIDSHGAAPREERGLFPHYQRTRPGRSLPSSCSWANVACPRHYGPFGDIIRHGMLAPESSIQRSTHSYPFCGGTIPTTKLARTMSPSRRCGLATFTRRSSTSSALGYYGRPGVSTPSNPSYTTSGSPAVYSLK